MFTSQYMNLDERSRLYPERDPGKTFPVTTPLERTLLIIIVIVVLIGIGLSVGIVSIKRARDLYEKNSIKLKNETSICYSSSCISEASNLLKSIDMSVDPCSDFYAFACGNWVKNAYLVSNLESQFTKLTRIITLRVKGILEGLEKAVVLPEHKEKTRDFYKSCMDKAHRNEVGTTEFLDDLKKFGGWPLIDPKWDASDFHWSDLMLQLFENGYASNMLFSIKLDVDAKNTSRSLISVMQPSLGLKDKLYYTISDGKLATSYKEVILELAKYLHAPDNPETENTMKDDIDDAFELERKIANLLQEVNMRNPDVFYNIMTLEELEDFAPKIPWRNLLRNMLSPETNLTNEERIMVPVPSMIKGLNKILDDMDNDEGKRKISNYMFYRTALFAAGNLNVQLYNLVKGLFNTDSVGNNELWEVCAKTTMDLFPLPLTSSYVAKYMKNNTKELLEEMFEDIKNALMEDILRAEWLDETTKSYALLKVNKMRTAIAYQEEIMEDENLDSYYDKINITDNHFRNVKQLVAAQYRRHMEGLHEKRDRFKWTRLDNLLTANAYYQPNANAIIIPVGVVQDTIFAAERPSYVNYGSLGMIVGHELMHAFDSIGSLYDAEGSYRMWWTETSWKKFEERVKCYKEQYNKFYMSEVDSNINGTLTLGENIADNGGLRTAYYAYNSLLKRLGSEKSLPGLPYNEKQMFWISFATVWCRKQTEESIQYGMKHSVHSPSRFRIIGSLSNMKEFSEDFKCNSNSTMNPKSKCSLWK